jgi:hypothetical protein
MAIGAHVTGVVNATKHGSKVCHVSEDVTNAPNSSGEPTLVNYILLEAADGYAVNHLDEERIVTLSVADVNNA